MVRRSPPHRYVVTVTAGTYLKGGPGETVTFRVPGGQIGRYRNVMIGAPQFQPGDEAVFFLSASGPSIAHIFGLSQGLFRVSVDARTGRRLVVPPVLMSNSDQAQTVVRGDPARRQLSLDEFAAHRATGDVGRGPPMRRPHDDGSDLGARRRVVHAARRLSQARHQSGHANGDAQVVADADSVLRHRSRHDRGHVDATAAGGAVGVRHVGGGPDRADVIPVCRLHARQSDIG